MGEGLAALAVESEPLRSPGVREAGGLALLDHAACQLAVDADPGARESAQRLLAWALAEGAPAEGRPVLGTAARLASSRAALLGGFRAHLLDLDDTHEDVRGHPSAVLFPALLALADDATPLSRVLSAHALGLEVMARLGRALGPAHYAAGWHPTGTVGGIGAAAAGAHLLELGRETTARALSLAATRSGGLRAQFGTDAKPLHAGIAASTGVESIAWARAGIAAAPGAVTGPAGLLAAHGAAGITGEELGADPAGSWAILSPGLWRKRHPFCSAAMSLADACGEIAGRLADPTASERAASIREVVIRIRAGADAALVHRRPTTGEEGRFSAEYIAALVLLGLVPDLAHLGTGPIPGLPAALLPRIEREHVAPGEAGSPSAPGPDPVTGRPRRDFWAGVRVRLHDGRTLEAQVERPVGSPEHPLGAAALRAKLAAALEGTDEHGNLARAAAVERAIAAPGTRVGTITALLAPGSASTA